MHVTSVSVWCERVFIHHCMSEHIIHIASVFACTLVSARTTSSHTSRQSANQVTRWRGTLALAYSTTSCLTSIIYPTFGGGPRELGLCTRQTGRSNKRYNISVAAVGEKRRCVAHGCCTPSHTGSLETHVWTAIRPTLYLNTTRHEIHPHAHCHIRQAL